MSRLPINQSTLMLFGENVAPTIGSAAAVELVDDRPIARNPPAQAHSPTTAVPGSLLRPFSPDLIAQVRSKTELIRHQMRSLGEPYYAEDGFILYNRDCLESLRALRNTDFRVPLTVTSPPYNIGKSYESIAAVTDYLAWCKDWIRAIYDVTTPTGAFWLNLGYLPVPGQGRAVPISYLLWDKTDFFMVQEVVWNYGAGVASKLSFSPRNEKWLFYVMREGSYTFNLDDVRDPNVKYPNQKKNGKFRCNPLGKNPTDVWVFPKVTTGLNRASKERTGHPAQFPLGIVERVVRVSSNTADVVLDPFSGSASTGIAALASGRVYVGFEKLTEYCEISVDRVRRLREMRREAESQPSLLINAYSADDSADELAEADEEE